MYWPGKGGARFIRPIRWIVALLDDQVIPFEIAGVQSGNESSGHRKLGATRFPVTYDNLRTELRENFVILSAEERRKRIRAVPTKYKCDNDLLEHAGQPHRMAHADHRHLRSRIPRPSRGSPDHGDAASTRNTSRWKTADGQLAPQFVAVTNTDGDPDGLIRHGNERVLRARFNDARFFWDSDQKRKLADRVEDLANVTFQAKLGIVSRKDRIACRSRW